MVCSALEALESLQNTKIHLQITETDLLKSHSIDISLFKELRSAQPFPCIYSDEVFAPYELESGDRDLLALGKVGEVVLANRG